MVVEVGWLVEETEGDNACEFLAETVCAFGSVVIGERVLAHGGKRRFGGEMDMFYLLDLTTKSWQRIPVSVEARSCHSLLLVDDKIYIHGGRTGASMERWDSVTHELEYAVERCHDGVSFRSTRRWRHTLEFYERKRVLLMFGGDDADTDGLLSYHVDAGIWERVKTQGTPPVGRRDHASCLVGDCMYVHGGKTIDVASKFLNDLWVLTLQPRPTWSTLGEHGTGRRAASISYVAGRLLVFGGKQSISPQLCR